MVLDFGASKSKKMEDIAHKLWKLDWQIEATRIDEIEAIIGGLKSLILLATILL